jgi:hypothetical protein
MAAIVAHLDARGVNLDIVYALDVIEKGLSRMELISGTLLAQPGPPKLHSVISVDGLDTTCVSYL